MLDSDGTLILNVGDLDGGTLATFKFAQQLNKPIYVVQVDDADESEVVAVIHWLQVNNIAMLNVAGPRESKRPKVYTLTLAFMDRLNERFGRCNDA